MGGLHRFTTWTGPMLTDSGGFQVFSLEGLRRIGEDGVEFQSHVDGTYRTLTPERAMEIQWALGADVAMAFDHVVPGQAPYELRAARGWSGRCGGWIGARRGTRSWPSGMPRVDGSGGASR